MRGLLIASLLCVSAASLRAGETIDRVLEWVAQTDIPTIDLTGVHGARLHCERWLGVEDSAKDVARILVNGVEIWRNGTNGGTATLQDVEWATVDADISALADGVANTKIRFELTTDASGHLGGWNVDDVTIDSISDCAPSESYGSGTAGSGGFVPVLATSGGFPYIGNPAFTVDGSQLLGGGAGLCVVGFVRTTLPFKGITILVGLAPPAFFVAVSASGPAGVPGAGTFALTGEIPDDPTLVGLEVDVQALMFDKGGPKGLSASAGLAFVICQ